ncbi:MAG: DUF4197 domain-containing protein [Halieaceae bacterium]
MFPLKLLSLSLLIGFSLTVQADWRDLLDALPESAKGAISTDDVVQATGLSQEEIVAGLKEALNSATEISIASLSKEGGYLDNPAVKIEMPAELSRVEQGLRQIGQDEMADEFVLTMNQAAEQAVPVALEQFQSAIDDMTLDDAQGILNGEDDAATQYFRKHSEPALREQFLPIVEEATANAGVTSTYQSIMSQLGSFSSFLQPQALDLDEYVTEEALNGLFTMVAQEEKRIRQDPVARSTELLEKVFGSD